MQCHLGPVKVLQKQEAPGHITFSNLLSSIIRFPISSSYVQEVTFMKRAISLGDIKYIEGPCYVHPAAWFEACPRRQQWLLPSNMVE
jgi:hypothetical protein